jgi:hypothetical protein
MAESVVATLGEHQALSTDRLGAVITLLADVTAFTVGGEEYLWVLVAATCGQLPRPRVIDGAQWWVS